MLARPPTRYARSGDASIAFQVMGEGPPDVVLIGGPASHLDLQWEEPDTRRGRQRIASFARHRFELVAQLGNEAYARGGHGAKLSGIADGQTDVAPRSELPCP